MTCERMKIGVFYLLALASWSGAQTTYYWNRNDVLTSSTDFSRAYNWTANADGTGAWPATADDDAFTSDALGGDWTFQDSDADAGTGAYSLTTNADQLTITGRGADVWGATNQFTALRRSDITGDFDVTVKVISVTNTQIHAKAGIFMADDFTSLASGGFAGVNWRGDGYVAFLSDISGNVGELETSQATGSAVTGPVWLRLVKSGSSVSGYYRNSLANAWTQVGTTQTIQSTAANSQVALLHTSHQAASTGTAVFDDFQGGTTLSATNNILSFAGTGSNADANATMSASQAAYSINFTGYTGTFNFGTYTLTLNTGDATFVSGQTVTAGSGTLAFTATSGTQTFTPKSGATFPGITKSGAGTVTVATHALTAGALNIQAGTWNWGSSTLIHNVAALYTDGASTLTFGTNTVQVSSGDMWTTGLTALNANTGTLEFTGTGTQTFTPSGSLGHPHIIHSGTGTLKLNSNNLSCLSFSQSAGILDFNGVNLTTTSSGNVTVTNGAATSVKNLEGRTVTVAGAASFTGQSGNLLNLNASSWTLTVTGALTASHAHIAGSNASGGTLGVATNSLNGGGNTNWSFSAFDPASWNYSMKINFNTTSTGANVSGNVTNFPMLVRLDSNNFFFSQAKSDGADIRFVDPDGSLLPHEIERWDYASRKGEVWVRVPQVDGNSNRDYVTLYWGNASATTLSDGKAVFDTAQGYQAVWHMKEGTAGTGTADLYQDATANDYDGDDYISATGTTGVVGLGQQFDGTDDYIHTNSGIAKFNDGDMSLSFWVKLAGNGGALLYKSDGDGSWESGEKFFHFGDGTLATGINGTRPHLVGNGNNWAISASSIALNDWHHVVFTWDWDGGTGGTETWYIDGAATSLSSSSYDASPADPTGSTVRIGYPNGNETSNYFSGYLDEMRFSSAVRSADHVKLSYETQKARTTALVYSNTDLSTWNYSSKVYVNTSATGANVLGDISNFPMLVRLTQGNFNFSQAKSDGTDLRFADSTGALLNYFVDRFDAANKTADIWVLLPTVKGNDNGQWFRMHWGKGTATSLSSGATVFNSSLGHVAAYPIEEGSGSTMADATNNAQTGTTNGNIPSQVTGIVGKGNSFDGNGDYVSVPANTVFNMSSTTRLTISAWVNRQGNAAAGSIEGIAGRYQWNAGNYREYALNHTNASTGFQLRYSTDGSSGTEVALSSNFQATNATWYHVVGVLDGAFARIYVNGGQRNSTAFTGNVYYTASGAFRIGLMEDNAGGSRQYWNGYIDQVQMANVAHSPDYIKLTYETQKAGASVLHFGARSPDFAKSARLNFNTTSSGANVSGNVSNIPILVRLTSSNLDFTQATAKGSDLLFLDPDGTRLYHEVVEWDPANQTGKVWVKVPQVNGNSSSDYITLYYGCPTCTANPQEIKDSVWSGYTSVFHLNAPEAQAVDAATLGNHGAYYQNQASIAGLTAANAAVFNGSSDYIDIPNESNYDYTGNVTVAAWIKVTSFPAGSSAIVTKGNATWKITRSGSTNNVEFVCTKSSTDYSAVGTATINDGGWHYVVGTYDGATVKVYVDGAASGTTAALTGSLDNTSSRVYIGENAGSAGKYWNGLISEVRLSGNSAVQSADFIKLSYESQKASSSLFSTPISTSSFTSSKVYKFNTTVSGARVSGDVYNFPLLLRITGSTMVDAVQSGAPDIRFLDADGVTWLDYLVERWDQTKDSAEVWVKVPKIDGNSGGDFITLYYNDASNGSVPDAQCATCVFDGNQFKARWSMNDSAASATVTDTRGAYNGTLKRSAAARNTSNNTGEGYVGPRSLSFAGTATPENVMLDSNSSISQNVDALTLSAWVKAGALGTVKRSVFFTRDLTTNGRAQMAVSVNSFVGGRGRATDASSATEDTTTAGALSTATWYHLVTQFDYRNDTIRVFINGTRYATNRSATRFTGRITSNTTSLTAAIGSNADGSSEAWQGLIDEVRVSPVALDSHWIKLSYQTQRKDSALLFNPSTADFVASRKYTFNTTKTGANISDSVTHIPILVRVTGSTIVDAVQNNAPDIRFLDGDGKTWLNYSVERWDKSVDSAEVWVLVPQVNGNSDNDFITLYYDDATNGGIADGQCASCVFSTSNYYQGVYYLNNSLNDATGNANNGTDNSSADAGGIIGRGRSFNGTSAYISLGNPASLNFSGAITMDVWVRWLASGGGSGRHVMTHGTGTSCEDWVRISGTNYQAGSWNGSDHNAAYTAVGDSATWVHLSGVYDGSSWLLYRNGALVATTTDAVGAITCDNNWILGAKTNTASRYFSGSLDQPSVSNTARSANWIKLSYENQRYSGNLFWNARSGPNNKASLTASAGTNAISLSWNSSVSDSSNADSVGIWVKYSAYPDSAHAASTTFVKKLVKTDTTYSYPATYPGTYYFGLAVRNTSGAWSPMTKAASDTAVLGGNAFLNDTIYVDSALGSDANSCAQARNPATPKLTLNSADGCDANASDTLVIRVMPGTYSGSNNESLDSDNKPVLVVSFDNNSRAVFNSSTGSKTYSSVTYYPTLFLWGNVSIKNLDIKAGVNNGVGVMTAFTGTDQYNVIEGCRIYNNGATKHNYGIFLPYPSLDYFHVANNLIVQPNTYGIYTNKDGSFNIKHNVIVGPGTASSKGIYMTAAAGAADMNISNNILTQWDYGIETASASIGTCSNNLFWQVTSGREVTGTSDAAKIIKDPLFASTTLGESAAYKLLPGSPAIDGGTTTTTAIGSSYTRSSPTDLFGTSRPQGASPDIGLYEGSGYAANPTGDFDSLTLATTSTTISVKNSKWKVVFDQGRGSGINAFYDMGDSTTNLLANASLLFDATVDSYVASAQTGNTIAPRLVWRSRTACQILQRLAVSASLDLQVYYTLQSSGHIYVQSELVNVTASSASVGTLTYAAKVGTASSVYSNSGTKSGFGYLSTSSRDVFFATIHDLDTAAASAETWTQSSASGAGGYVQFSTSGLADPPGKFRRAGNFLLYIGDGSLTFAKAAALNADANAPSPLTLYNGTPLHAHSWQSQLMGHWSFDEGGGATLRDNSVYQSNNGTLTSMTYVSGKVGAGGQFTTSSSVSVADNAALEASLYFTLALWVNPTWASIAGTVPYVVWKGTGSSDGYNLQKVSGQNQLTFTMGSGTVTVDVPSAAWSHLAFVVDAGQIHAYVNGVLKASGTANATATANASALIFGDATGGDNFYGSLDDIRVYANSLLSEEVQALARQGFARKDGLYHLRADNNNRVVLALNPDAAASRLQPAFAIDNWFAGKTPKYVYLNGVRLKPLVDYVSDTAAIPFTGFGSRLYVQVNKTVTAQNANLFIDDDDSTGYLGASSLMPRLSMTTTASDKIAIKNFSDTTFGAITSKQWYMELDLNGWTSWSTLRVVDSGFGDINVWKAAAVNPGLAISSSTNQVGIEGESGRTLVGMKFDATGSGIYSGGAGYAGPANITYTVTDSSSVRFSIVLTAMSMQSGDGTFTLTKRWTFYPNGRVFGSYVISALSFNLDNPTLDFDSRYNSSPTALFNTTYSDTYARGGWMGGDPAFHSFIGGYLSIKNATSNYVGNATTSSADLSSYSGNSGGEDFRRMRIRSNTSQYTSANSSITTNFFVDVSRDFNDSATADSLAADLQSPGAITAITGTAVTNDALDFNADGFAEGDGAYTYQANASGIAQFSFNATVPHFDPAFRIKNWTFGTLPDFVFIDNQSQIAGYNYNAYVDVANSTLVLQFNKTLSGGSKIIHVSHKSGLAVTLRQLAAHPGPGVDTLKWVTESEVDNLGYHIWRRTQSHRPDGGVMVSSLQGNLDNAKLQEGEIWVANSARMSADIRGGSGAPGDTVPAMAVSADQLRAQGWQRINDRMVPGAPEGRSGGTREYAYIDHAVESGAVYEYVLEAVDNHGVSAFYGSVAAGPLDALITGLQGAYPNPFNPVTTLRFTLASPQKVSLVIYNAAGQVVRTLVRPDRPLRPGRYRLYWDTRNDNGHWVASGPYFYQFKTPKYNATKKMILMK